jgi:hypothetical protein
MKLVKGNTYSLNIQLTNNSDQIITAQDVYKVEFCFGGTIKKYYPKDATFSVDHFIVPLTQEETFALDKLAKHQIRVLFRDGSVKASDIILDNIMDSLSKEVLTND